MTIRQATAADASVIAALVHELAAFEDRPEQASPDIDALRRDLDGDGRRFCRAFVVEIDGEAVGFALYYPTYSTFRTSWGIHLEDLYVREAYRSEGIGTALMEELAREARTESYDWIEWYVLDWNDAALEFYRSLGAREVDNWLMMVLHGSQLDELGG